MELTARDIMQMLREYSRTPEGKKQIEAHGYGSGDNTDTAWLRELAEELRNDINNAFKRVTTSHAQLTSNLNDIKISTRVKGKNGVIFTLTFPPYVLGRLSLEVERNINGRIEYAYTGSNYYHKHAAEFSGLDDRYGVYDIIGLFTNGYNIESAVLPKGHWVYADSEGNFMGEALISSSNTKVQARRSREPNDFVKITINNFIQRHRNEFPNLQVEYPVEWGGTK